MRNEMLIFWEEKDITQMQNRRYLFMFIYDESQKDL